MIAGLDSGTFVRRFQLFPPRWLSVWLAVFVLSLRVSPSHPFNTFFCVCFAVEQKGDADGSFKKESQALQEKVIHFRTELQQAHDE